jgi:hypothetical protein
MQAMAESNWQPDVLENAWSMSMQKRATGLAKLLPENREARFRILPRNAKWGTADAVLRTQASPRA